MADNCLVNLRNIVPDDPLDGTLEHERPLLDIWTPVEIVKDLERHGTTVVERMRYGGTLRCSSTRPYQCTLSAYPRGARRVSMVTDDPYEEDLESDTEDEFDSHHLQGFSCVVVNNVRCNDSRTPRNPDPEAVQSRRERSLPFTKNCHACG